jgi:hypothetical protein
MSMVGQVASLWPQDGNHPAIAPFSDLVVSGTRLTGDIEGFSEGCSKLVTVVGVVRCREVTSYEAYRALTSINLTIGGNLRSTYGTAATAAIPPVDAWGLRAQTSDTYAWNTSEVGLPGVGP